LLQGWHDIVTDAGAQDEPPRFRLAPVLRTHMPSGTIGGEYHGGRWTDVGTPQRLEELDRRLTPPD